MYVEVILLSLALNADLALMLRPYDVIVARLVNQTSFPGNKVVVEREA